MSTIEELAARQLDAYNRSDLEAFVACYHEEVCILEEEGPSVRGREAFRERYRGLFEDWTFGAEVPERLVLDGHCVDLEHWWRIEPGTGERSEGSVLVHYTERDGLIGTVRFLD